MPPDVEQCMAKGPECLGIANNALMCRREGSRVWMCSPCLKEWRRLAQQQIELQDCCPRCADAYLNRIRSSPMPPRTEHPTLKGSAARAINEAMRQEGILPPQRQSVLRRLHRDASWLEFEMDQPEILPLKHTLSPGEVKELEDRFLHAAENDQPKLLS
jgi:Zn-finger nucleic acid-binding protein